MIALGDIRNVITPLGYWFFWGAWISYALHSRSSEITDASGTAPHQFLLKLIIFGCFWLISAFLISSIYNSSMETYYQGIKLIVIFIIGWLIFENSNNIDQEFILINCFYVIWISLSVYLVSKYIFPSYHVVLGDGRQGSILAYPGVLWKVGAFFSIIIFSRYVSLDKLNLKLLLTYLAGLLLVVLDGSRTGFIWISFSTIFLLIMRAFKQGKLFCFSEFNVLALSIICATVYWIKSANESNQELSTFFLPFERLVGGDSVREKMITDAWMQADKCLPLGCGFGSAVTWTADQSMVVHNAYLALLVDVGVLGLGGFLMIVFGPFFILINSFLLDKNILNRKNSYFTAGAGLGVAGFCFTMMIHPLSTEMSEWGLFFLMAAWMFLKANKG